MSQPALETSGTGSAPARASICAGARVLAQAGTAAAARAAGAVEPRVAAAPGVHGAVVPVARVADLAHDQRARLSCFRNSGICNVPRTPCPRHSTRSIS